MRLWSLHPNYLDAKGLVALWREALLAQAVLRGQTKGYKHHPQLDRFYACTDTIGAIGNYLTHVHDEATVRGYQFDKAKIYKVNKSINLRVKSGQLAYEFAHLLNKLSIRDRDKYGEVKKIKTCKVNPLFKMVKGGVESWEVVSA
jgi:hypothetical protein